MSSFNGFCVPRTLRIGYNWSFDGTFDKPYNLRPKFDIRNRSGTRTYYLANVAYLKGGKPIASFDNKSIWGFELKPGTISQLTAAPVAAFSSISDCLNAEVEVRLQNGRTFWLRGQGPGQERLGKMQAFAFSLRNKLEEKAVPLE
jgi:hypothetical protein